MAPGAVSNPTIPDDVSGTIVFSADGSISVFCLSELEILLNPSDRGLRYLLL